MSDPRGGSIAGLPVLTYHGFGPERSPLATDPSRFADTLDALLGSGHRPVDLLDWVALGRPDVSRRFALAFDDGLRSVLRVADVVHRHRVPATVFLVTGRVGLDNAWPGQPGWVPVEPSLAWPDVQALARLGFSFASHGVTHARLDRLPPDRLDRELAEARSAIEDRTGRDCPLLAYPYGRSSPAVRSAASRHHAAAFGTRLDYADQAQDAYDLSRIDAYYLRDGRLLARLIEGRAGGWLGRRRRLRAARRALVACVKRTGESPGASIGAFHAPDKSCPSPVCPDCRGPLDTHDSLSFTCPACAREFPAVAGLPDLRLGSDRYLSLDAERVKAERLARAGDEPGADVSRVAAAYYALTDDVADRRRGRFLRHIDGAEARGAALAGRLPGRGLTLEVGCGTGGLLVAAGRAGRAVVGVDLAARWLVVARRRLADHGLSVPLFAACAGRLPWPDATFDAVAADSLLEHLDDPAAALREWRRVVRPGGSLVVWSPNRFTLTTDPHLGLWGVGWLPRAWVPHYLRLRRCTDWPPRVLSAAEARRLAVASGWERVTVEPPEITEEWSGSRPAAERLAIRAYSAARRVPGLRALIRAVGPLWELRAEAPT